MPTDHVIMTEENSTSNEGQVQLRVEVKTHPDGGWGWVVCFAAFFIQFLILGMQNCFGILYTALVDTLKTDRGATGEKHTLFLLNELKELCHAILAFF